MGRLPEKIFRGNSEATSGIKIIQDAISEKGTVTFIFAAHDEQHNNAVALKEYLEK